MKTITNEELYALAKSLASNNLSAEDIETQLLQKTTDKELVSALTKDAKKAHYTQKRKDGLFKLMLGALFLLTGFFITCVFFHSNKSFDLVMYSFTTVGLSFIFWGLYEIIG
ncbi:MAG: hypothetical protein ABL940_09920 [Bacteroidia bacterium]